MHSNKAPAKDYDTLQGIAQIQAVFDSIGNIDQPHLRAYLVSAQSKSLILLNTSELFDRCEQLSTRISQPTYLRLATHLKWIIDALRVSIKLRRIQERNIRSIEHVKNSKAPTDNNRESFMDAYERFSRALVARTSEIAETLTSAIERGGLESHPGLVCHSLKQIPILWELSHVVGETTLNEGFNELINSEALREANESYRIPGDTYLDQFRLYHQVPELLGREAVRNIRIILAQPQHAETELRIGITIDLLDVIVDCIRPLIDNLLPYEYHKIREALGQTSGSDSTTLRHELFTDKLIEIKRASAEPEAPKALKEFADRYESYAKEWRTTHRSLPRNVLGGGLTRSLIGNDAIKATQNMQLAAEKRVLGPKAHIANAALPLRDNGLDEALLAYTGSVTQKHFPDVQNRPPRPPKNTLKKS